MEVRAGAHTQHAANPGSSRVIRCCTFQAVGCTDRGLLCYVALQAKLAELRKAMEVERAKRE